MKTLIRMHGCVVSKSNKQQKIKAVIPVARAWNNPPKLTNVQGAINLGFNKDEKAFEFELDGAPTVSFTIETDQASPIVNPCFVFYHSTCEMPAVKINDKVFTRGQDLRVGRSHDTEGKQKMVIWMQYESEDKTNVIVTFKK